jgi:penicillin-binding protein 2
VVGWPPRGDAFARSTCWPVTPNSVLYSSATDGPDTPDPVPPWETIITTAYSGLSAGRVPVSRSTLAWLRTSLRGVTEHGTGFGPFARAAFPLDKLPVASKTGTAEVFGKQSTSWFATFAPATRPEYAVVMMVSQGGTGSGVSGPSVAELYKTLFGVTGQQVDLAKASPRGGRPTAALPQVRADGTVVQP